VSTLPHHWTAEEKAASSTAEIEQVGKRLYVSNRGHDSPAVFETLPELRLIQHTASGGQHPRHFIVVDDRWLLIANRDSNNLVCLPLDSAGLLGTSVAEVFCPSPVCIALVR